MARHPFVPFALIAGVLVLVACVSPIAPVEPAPSDEAAPIPAEIPASAPDAPLLPECPIIDASGQAVDCGPTPPAGWVVARDIACEPIIEFNLDLAGAQAVDNGLLVGWTFGVNFDLVFGGRPLACLRLYHVDPTGSSSGGPTLVPIDHGGILVDSCLDSHVPIAASDGVALFCGAGAVSCTMNLGAWFTTQSMADYVDSSDFALSSGEPVSAHLQGMVPLNLWGTYPALSIVAREGWAPPANLPDNIRPTDEPYACGLTEKDQPILSFTPDGEAVQHELTLPYVVDGPGVAFEPNCSTEWWNPEAAWNTTYKYLAVDSGAIDLFYENLLGGTSNVHCQPGTAATEVAFWLGPGTLTIGYKDGSSFDGVIDGVLIDPLNSKPPSYDP